VTSASWLAGSSRSTVLADALGLLRLVQEPVAVGLLQAAGIAPGVSDFSSNMAGFLRLTPKGLHNKAQGRRFGAPWDRARAPGAPPSPRVRRRSPRVRRRAGDPGLRDATPSGW